MMHQVCANVYTALTYCREVMDVRRDTERKGGGSGWGGREGARGMRAMEEGKLCKVSLLPSCHGYG